MIAFIISLLIFMIFYGVGIVISFKIPKININIPQPIYEIGSYVFMIVSFYYENDRIFQIFISLVTGLIVGYLRNCSENEK